MQDELFNELAEALQRLAKGDFSDLPQGQDPISQAVREMAVTRQQEAVQQLDRVVDYTMLSNELAMASATILVSSTNIGKSAERVASTSTELSASVASINKAITSSREQTGDMRMAAEESHSDMTTAISSTQQTEQAMSLAAEKTRSLLDASEQISKVVGGIDTIAKQTNLLALNASVEAARAGDAGRGFSVVAQEVRALSQQTAGATASIREMVGTLRQEVDAIATAVEDAHKAATGGRENLKKLGTTMAALVDGIATVDDQLSGISTSVAEQSGAAEELANAAEESSGLANENIARVESSEASLNQLISMAGSELAEAALIDAPNKIARLAKADHVIWKKRLSDMFTGKLKLREDELANHTLCRLGKWYYGPDSTPFRNAPAFRDLEAPHERVHAAGIKAVELYNTGHHREALRCMEEVESASQEVIALLNRLISAGDTQARYAA